MQRFSDYAAPAWRFFIGAWAIQTWHAAFVDPGSRMYRIAQYQDSASIIWLIGGIGVVMMLDSIINDALPDDLEVGKWSFKLRWEKVFEQRHWLFGILALAYAVNPGIMSATGRSVEAESFFYLQAAQALAAAFVDVKLRVRGAQWQRA